MNEVIPMVEDVSEVVLKGIGVEVGIEDVDI